MNLFQQLTACTAPTATRRVDKSKTAARYKAVTEGEFCAKDAAQHLKIRHGSASETLERLADDGWLIRTQTVNQGHGRPTQFYRWP